MLVFDVGDTAIMILVGVCGEASFSVELTGCEESALVYCGRCGACGIGATPGRLGGKG